LDRFALQQLQDLVGEVRRAYDRFEFHRVYQALHNYCVVDLSSFYLDVLKDRLYTAPPRSVERRSAQTVLYEILSAVVRIMAPVLSFTADEIWWYLLAINPALAASVHLEVFPEVNADYQDQALLERWTAILALRSDVSRALEVARQLKVIGHSLDARVTLALPEDLRATLAGQEALLGSVCIVSQLRYAEGSEPLDNTMGGTAVPGLKIRVEAAEGVKCERCWVWSLSVGQHAAHPTVCTRCRQALAVMGG
jgi:isoleucyl-tRNA synthetase